MRRGMCRQCNKQQDVKLMFLPEKVIRTCRVCGTATVRVRSQKHREREEAFQSGAKKKPKRQQPPRPKRTQEEIDRANYIGMVRKMKKVAARIDRKQPKFGEF